jgi:hypothetical protein
LIYTIKGTICPSLISSNAFLARPLAEKMYIRGVLF